MAAVERAGVFDDTAFVLVADHGMEENDPTCRGDWDVSLRDAGLRVRDEAANWRIGYRIEADIILKATKVDGVYTADPKLDPTANPTGDLADRPQAFFNLEVQDEME